MYVCEFVLPFMTVKKQFDFHYNTLQYYINNVKMYKKLYGMSFDRYMYIEYFIITSSNINLRKTIFGIFKIKFSSHFYEMFFILKLFLNSIIHST